MKPTKRNPLAISEHAEQKSVIAWARMLAPRYPPLGRLFAIPNAAKRSKTTAALMLAEGLQSGIPDLFLPWPNGTFAGLWLEMKRRDASPSDTTAAQRDCIAYLNSVGYKAIVCKGASEAIHALRVYMSIGEGEG